MISDIDQIFEMLSWDKEEAVQLKGIEEGKKIKHLSVFILPSESKSVWENCAKVIISKSDIELKPYLINLLEWLKDMNWPGADLVYERLQKMSKNDIKCAYNICLTMAHETNDRSWQQSLEDFWKSY